MFSTFEMACQFHEAGYKFFPINHVYNGACGCGTHNCQAIYKHPMFKNWQQTPTWSDEQILKFQENGDLKTGYGVLVTGKLLVIDVDARNGGVESIQKLIEEIPEIVGAGMIVETGSGGGSKHYFFKAPEGVAVLQHLDDYKGIDFKSSGFVVGAGSMHKSGKPYTTLEGDPYEITEAPKKLIELLKKPEMYRANYDGTSVDLKDSDIASMLLHLDPNCSHDEWIRIGMAIHHGTGGTGFDLWDGWSAKSDKYDGTEILSKRWHSFGKNANPVTVGTLIHYAKNNGWAQQIEFVADDIDYTDFQEEPENGDIDTSGVDLLSPPGFVGDLAKWIDDQSYSPRKNLSVAAALTAIGNVAGLNWREELTGVTLNLMCFCVAGSGTGKEAIIGAFNKIMSKARLVPATHGTFKSDKEVIKNLTRNQAAFYCVDEVGGVLSKVENARKKGGASYLEGLVERVMEIFTKAGSSYPLGGDAREEIIEALQKQLHHRNKMLNENEGDKEEHEKVIQSITTQINNLNEIGLVKPFLSMIGFTTPESFGAIITPEFVKNGFMSRSLLFDEKETNPKFRKGHKPPSMPLNIEHTIMALAGAGVYEIYNPYRIENYGHQNTISTDNRGIRLLESIREKFWEYAELYKEQNGFESIPRRGYELVSKVSAILAVPTGVRTYEHVLWAYALVKRDMDTKAMLAFSNDKNKDKNVQLLTRIMSRLGKDVGLSVSVLHNRIPNSSKKSIEEALALLEKQGKARQEDKGRTIKWFSA